MWLYQYYIVYLCVACNAGVGNFYHLCFASQVDYDGRGVVYPIGEYCIECHDFSITTTLTKLEIKEECKGTKCT